MKRKISMIHKETGHRIVQEFESDTPGGAIELAEEMCSDFTDFKYETQMVQHFTYNELLTLSNAVISAQNRLDEVSKALYGKAIDFVLEQRKELADLNTKICEYITDKPIG